MIINNAVLNGKKVNLITSGGKIKEITERVVPTGFDVHGKRIIPGLIDIHTHGCMDMDTMDADFEQLCLKYAAMGTTSFLPTTMTMDYDSLERVTNAETKFYGANILGFHFEGPYISKKYKGAQNEKFLRTPNVAEFARFKNVKMITLAPELDGAMEFIRAVTPECAVSLGHTDCDYETALKAIENGADCLTHTFNAMPPLHHRNPGPIGAACEKKIYAQFICDGFHISKPVILAAYRMFGAERMTLISDSIRCAGMPDGIYECGGLEVRLKDGAARLVDGTIAGSCACLMDCVRKAVEFGIPFDDAVCMATKTPASLLGVNKGEIKEGFDADILVINDDLTVSDVIINGETINPRHA